MKAIVITSDRRSFLLTDFAKQFNKYWSAAQEVTVLYFQNLECDLPENFKPVSLGIDKGISKWTDNLIPYFQSLEEDHFFLCFDDHYAIAPVDINLMEEAEKKIRDEGISKVWLCVDPKFTGVANKYDENFNIWNPKLYRYTITSSLCPSIWRKDLFLYLARPNLDPWKFETTNLSVRGDGKFKVLLPNKYIYESMDARRGGKWNSAALRENGRLIPKGNKEDIELFRKLKEEYDRKKI